MDKSVRTYSTLYFLHSLSLYALLLQIHLIPGIGAYAQADGRVTFGVGSVGLELRGELLHTLFNLILDIHWPEFPIINV